jgi:hypothetical protein
VSGVNAQASSGTVTTWGIDAQSSGISPKEPKVRRIYEGVALPVRSAEEHSSKENMMDKVDDNLKSFGKVVETVAGVVGTVAAAATTVATVGAALASKETQPHASSSMTPQYGLNAPNADGYDNSVTGSVWSGACSLPPPDIMPDPDLDPMSIKAVSNRAGLLGTFSLSTSSGENGNLVKWVVNPGMMPRGISINQDFVPTPMAFIASHFKFWRGDIVMEVTAVKSPMQTGTLVIKYDMSSTGSTTDPKRAPMLHRVVWDLKQQSKIVVTFPFRWTTHWREFAWYPEDSNTSQGFPTMSIDTVQPLISNENVSSIIDLIITVRSPNLRVAFPLQQISIRPEPTPLMFKEENRKKQEGVAVRPKMIKIEGREEEIQEEEEHSPLPKGLRIVAAEEHSMLSGGTNTNAGGPYDPSIMDHEMTDSVYLGMPHEDMDKEEFQARTISNDEVHSIRDVLKRFQVFEELTFANVTGVHTYFKGNGSARWGSWIEGFAPLFVWSCGGLRWKGLFGDSSASYTGVGTAYLDFAQGVFKPTGPPHMLLCDNKHTVFEITMPNVSAFPLYLLNKDGDGVYRRPPWHLRGKPPSLNCIAFVAASDDMVWGGMNYMYPQQTLTLGGEGTYYDGYSVVP